MGYNEDISARIVAIGQEILEAQDWIKKHKEEMKKTKKPEKISSLEASIAWQEQQIEVLGNEREDLLERLTRKEPTAMETITAIRNAQEKARKERSRGTLIG